MSNITVKNLVWDRAYIAATPFGSYQIVTRESYPMNLNGFDLTPSTSYVPKFNNFGIEPGYSYGDLDSAIAAANADFQSRIVSVIE